MRRWLPLLGAVATAFLPGGALAVPPPVASAGTASATTGRGCFQSTAGVVCLGRSGLWQGGSDPSRSRSGGYPWRGRLVPGHRVEEGRYLRHVDVYRRADRFYGTAELVALVQRAAMSVAARLPGARLAVGEISQRGGGRIRGHRSHQSGRDADLGFYLLDRQGRSVEAPQFVPIHASGAGRVGDHVAYFDIARNWLLVEALLADGTVPVQHIFVADRIRRWLLRHARRAGADPRVVERARRVLMAPGEHAQAHLDHFHVRIYCAPEDQAVCRDRGPYWDWIPPAFVPLDRALRDTAEHRPSP